MRVATSNPTVVAYGQDPSQFAQLWLSPDQGERPVVVLIHGGFWRAQYALDLMEPLAADLVGRGFAVWNIEYRRVGQAGGGYPGTLEDVAAAVDKLADIADQYHLDLASVVTVGHSAGGQLALWAATRSALKTGQPGADPMVLPRLGIGQGPVFDLRAGDEKGLGNGAVTDFIGGSFRQYPDRYEVATPSPAAGVQLVVVRGLDDTIVPPKFTVPTPLGDVRTVDVPGDHFTLIDPSSPAWQAVIEQIG